MDRIVKAQDMSDYVAHMRAQFVGLGEDALGAVKTAVRGGDAKLGYKILEDTGIVPNRDERVSMANERLATQPDEQESVTRAMGQLMLTAIHRNRVYGTRDSQLEEEVEKQGYRINYDKVTIEPLDENPRTAGSAGSDPVGQPETPTAGSGTTPDGEMSDDTDTKQE